MDKKLKVILDFIFAMEGGYVHRSKEDDPGGATKFGISLPLATAIGLDLNKDGKVTKEDIMLVTRDDFDRIIRDFFYVEVRGAELPFPMALALTDTAVMSGPGSAIRLLQRTARLVDDGLMGANTMKAAKTPHMVLPFMVNRSRRLETLMNYKANANGWISRNLQLYAVAASQQGRGLENV